MAAPVGAKAAGALAQIDRCPRATGSGVLQPKATRRLVAFSRRGVRSFSPFLDRTDDCLFSSIHSCRQPVPMLTGTVVSGRGGTGDDDDDDVAVAWTGFSGLFLQPPPLVSFLSFCLYINIK